MLASFNGGLVSFDGRSEANRYGSERANEDASYPNCQKVLESLIVERLSTRTPGFS